MLAKANENQQTNIRPFIKEKFHKKNNNNNSNEINKNYFLHITQSQSISTNLFKLVLN